ENHVLRDWWARGIHIAGLRSPGAEAEQVHLRRIRPRSSVPDEGQRTHRSRGSPIERVGDEEHSRENVAGLVVEDRQSPGPRGVSKSLAAGGDLVAGRDDRVLAPSADGNSRE